MSSRKIVNCPNCKALVSYKVLKRKSKTIIRGIDVFYTEYYAECVNCECEVHVPEINEVNKEHADMQYQKMISLLCG